MTAESQKRYGYHAFPRRSGNTRTATVRKGLAILSSMARSGLLLRPEIVTVPGEILADGTVGEESYIGERFASFSIRTAETRLQHARDFGSFAIEFDVAKLIALGALPVFYLPLRHDQPSAGRALGARTAELTRFLERIVSLNATARDVSKPAILLTVAGRPAMTLDRSSVATLLDTLMLQIRPIDELLDALRVLTSLVYPLDADPTDEVRFFEQREWRLLSNVLDPRHYDAGPPTPEERTTLLAIDRAYFTKELAFRSGLRSRIDECTFVRLVEGSHFLTYARRVIVPDDAAAAEARKLLSREAPNLEITVG